MYMVISLVQLSYSGSKNYDVSERTYEFNSELCAVKFTGSTFLLGTMVRPAGSILECPDIMGVWNVNNASSHDNATLGGVTLSKSDTGPYIHFVCPEGSHVIGPSMITCLQSGVWDDTTKPSCSSSTIFGIYQSDIILISVLAASGALVILGLTIVLSHLLCLKDRNKTPSLCHEGLDRSSESNPSSSPYYIDDKCIHSISIPTSVTMNGHPLQTSNQGNYHQTNSNIFQTRSMERNPVVLSYNPSQDERTFSLPRFFVHTPRPCGYPSSQTPNDIQGYFNHEVPTSGRSQAMTLPRRQDHVFLNNAFTNDTPQDFNDRWQDSVCDEDGDSFSSDYSEIYENIN